jgi:hypothetical protein
MALSITTTNDAQTLVSSILTPGISFSNLSYTGGISSSGTFTGGLSAGLDFDTGIILTTGLASDAPGPNRNGNSLETSGSGEFSNSEASTNLNGDGDANLNALAGYPTQDATVLKFDFTSTGVNGSFTYIFASEEYINFENTKFNDVFAFFLDGNNIALLPDRNAVSINNVNSVDNPTLFRRNVNPAPFDIQYDGFTIALTANLTNLTPGMHTLKLAIADGSDGLLDSAVFIQAGSFDLTTVTITAIDAIANEPFPIDTGTYRVTRAGINTFPLTVKLNLTPGSGLSLSDYTLTDGAGSLTINGSTATLVIPAGSSSVDIILTPTDDLQAEAAETLALSLIADPAYTIGAPSNAVVTIQANDPGFMISGAVSGDLGGWIVSDAGDVNGDGLSDLLVGAPSASPNGKSSAGKSYLVYGKSNTTEVNLSALNGGSGGFILNGETAGDEAGISVSSAGDVNGDGLADLIIGAHKAAPGGRAFAGKSYVVFGKTNASPVELSTVAGGNGGFVINGEGGRSGRSVSNAGDVNGDGLDDLVVGAWQANGKAGKSYVVFGKTNGSPVELSAVDSGTGGFVINGQGSSFYDLSGFSVSGAGDINGDGLDDVIIGAYGATPPSAYSAGKTYVVFGKTSGAPVNLNNLGSAGFIINGEGRYDQSGRSVSSAGDVNGDGFEDLIIGAPNPDGSHPAGRSYVVFGKSNSAPVNLSEVAVGTGGFAINGEAAGDQSGYSVSKAGDVNGDGLDDLIIGAFGADPSARTNAGKSYLVYGKTSGTAINLGAIANGTASTSGFVLTGEATNDSFGRSVSNAGDVNGDGLADLIVGAPGAGGKSYVVYGSNSTGSINRFGTTDSDTFTGTANGQSLVGAQGNDTLSDGGFTNTVLYGGTGDDILRISNANFKRINGGLGNDTLALNGSGFNLDLTGTSDNTKLISLETIIRHPQ